MNRNLRIVVPLSRAVTKSLKNPYQTPMRTFLVPQRAWDPFSHLDSTFKEMDRQFQRMEREMNSIFRDFGGFPQLTANRALPLREEPVVYSLEAPSNEIKPQVVEGEKENKYQLNLYMGENFKPEDVKISLKDRVLTIEAKAEVKDENSRFYQEVSRSFLLPEKADLNELKTVLTPDGILKLEAPFPKEELKILESKPQEIAINRE